MCWTPGIFKQVIGGGLLLGLNNVTDYVVSSNWHIDFC